MGEDSKDAAGLHPKGSCLGAPLPALSTEMGVIPFCVCSGKPVMPLLEWGAPQ